MPTKDEINDGVKKATGPASLAIFQITHFESSNVKILEISSMRIPFLDRVSRYLRNSIKSNIWDTAIAPDSKVEIFHARFLCVIPSSKLDAWSPMLKRASWAGPKMQKLLDHEQSGNRIKEAIFEIHWNLERMQFSKIVLNPSFESYAVDEFGMSDFLQELSEIFIREVKDGLA